MIKIGDTELKNPWILAPMAGVSDLPFRLLALEMGAGLVCTEMISAKAILYNNKNTRELMRLGEQEHPVSLQLFGSDPVIMGEIAKRIEPEPFDILDINMGCPVPKVVNNGEGSALMKDPVLAGRIIESVARSIKKPVTVKIRKGFDDEHVNACEIARIAQESGAKAVTVHARTREQYYSGEADLEVIAAVKARLSVPVIGNGDVRDLKSAEHMMSCTGCDAVAIGRAAMGNPWIFRELNAKDGGYEKPSPSEVIDMLERHAGALVDFKGEYTGIREMRRHAGWYLSGMRHAARLRVRLNEIETLKDLTELMEAFRESLTGEV
ncbi:MAG TPA: tRNA dihydrouridine synthase DusB [Lachnospiraceae bacterium]|nr:tRNA dihydrouridine synthase DusB [Lachnospiraceae bacterium]